MKPLTLGRCIASVCAACGVKRAEGILRFAVNSNILVFPGQRRIEIVRRDAVADERPNSQEAAGLIRYFLWDNHRRPTSHRGTPPAHHFNPGAEAQRAS